MLTSWVGIPIEISLKMSPGCQTLSKAFWTSRRIAAVFLPRFVARNYVVKDIAEQGDWTVVRGRFGVFARFRNHDCDGGKFPGNREVFEPDATVEDAADM